MSRSRRLMPLALLAVAAAMAAVSASLFVYYPVVATIQPQAPPVVLEGGTNANGTDLAGNTIEVYLGENRTSAMLTLHPTYQRNLYYDILRVTNTDTANTYYAILRLDAFDLGGLAGDVKIYVYDSNGNWLATIDSTVNSSTGWRTLNAGSSVSISVEIDLPEGQNINGATGTMALTVIYSPQNQETPP